MGIAAWSGALLDWEGGVGRVEGSAGANFWAQGAEGDGERLP